MLLGCACQWKKTKSDHSSVIKMPCHRSGSSGWCCGAGALLPRYPSVLTCGVTCIFCCSSSSEPNMSGIVLGIFISVWRFAHDQPFSDDTKAIQLCPISKIAASLFPTTHQHVKGDLLLLFVAPRRFNHVIFFTTTQLQLLSALCVQGLLGRYCCFAARRKRSCQLPGKGTRFFYWKCWFILLPVYKHFAFNLLYLWNFLRYLQRKSTSLPQCFLSSENKLSLHFRRIRGTPSPLCGSCRLPHAPVGHWWSVWLQGCLHQAGSSPSQFHGLWRLWTLHSTAGFHKTLLPGWFASLSYCISLSDPAPDQPHFAT